MNYLIKFDIIIYQTGEWRYAFQGCTEDGIGLIRSLGHKVFKGTTCFGSEDDVEDLYKEAGKRNLKTATFRGGSWGKSARTWHEEPEPRSGSGSSPQENCLKKITDLLRSLADAVEEFTQTAGGQERPTEMPPHTST